jgi:hypothetical protein
MNAEGGYEPPARRGRARMVQEELLRALAAKPAWSDAERVAA